MQVQLVFCLARNEAMAAALDSVLCTTSSSSSSPSDNKLSYRKANNIHWLVLKNFTNCRLALVFG